MNQKGIINILILGVIAVVVLAFGGYFVYTKIKHTTSQNKEITTFEECAAKYPVLESYPRQCKTPDNRTFVEQVDETATWNMFSNGEYGFSFKYPFGFFYQEPKFLINNCSSNFLEKCPSSLDLYLSNNPGEKKTINNVPYCYYEESEGAAGSVYTNYYYTTVKNQKCITINFLLRYTNCGVYGFPEDQAYKDCETENNTTIPNTFNKVISTFNFSK